MLRDGLERYMEELRRGLREIDLEAVESVVRTLLQARREGRQVFLFGNGGSAALASHMASDLNNTGAIPGQPRLRAVALTDNVPLLTALANDISYEQVFAEQIRTHCRPGDVAVAVSCSGESANVLAAVREARHFGARVIGLTGHDGGSLARLSHICVRAPVEAIWQQEDVHLALEHAISQNLRQVVLSASRRARRAPRALVLAAGQGSRLLPLTEELPKPMVSIGGEPLLHHTLGWLRAHGIEDVAINLHYCPEVIPAHFGDGSELGLRLHYSYEERRLGTAGAVHNLDGFLDGGPLLVVYGDVLTDLDLGSLLHFHHESVTLDPAVGATLTVHRAEDPSAVGVVTLDEQGRVTRFVEKPEPGEVDGDLASSGVLVLEPAVLDHIPSDRESDFGHDVLPRLLEAGVGVMAWNLPDHSYLRDIGTLESFRRAEREWLGREGDGRGPWAGGNGD